MSSQKHPLTNSKECWTFVVAAAITALLYVALIITISKEVHLRGFLFLEAGTTAKIFEFYAENLRGSLFTNVINLSRQPCPSRSTQKPEGSIATAPSAFLLPNSACARS